MKKQNLTIGFFFLAILLQGCLVMQQPFTGLAPGPWRGVIRFDPQMVSPNPKGEPLPEKMNLEFEEVAAGELPFTIEVTYLDEQHFFLEIINGNERIKVDDIQTGRDIRTAKDTILIRFPVSNSYIKGYFEESILEGSWISDATGQQTTVPFVARQGQDFRFTQLKKPPLQPIGGTWTMTLGLEGDQPSPAILEIQQEDNHLSGTIKSQNLDCRNMEGTIQANKLYLSYFNGREALLLEAKVREDGTLIGTLQSATSKTIWEAKRNEGTR